MQAEVHTTSSHLIDISVEIVSAYVKRNHVSAAELPSLVRTVHATLSTLACDTTRSEAVEAVETSTPTQVRKSITPDALISFIDGRSYKTLKRHLSSHGLDPRRYRERYGLPKDYPMVAASYAALRSELAKAIGLGRPATSA